MLALVNNILYGKSLRDAMWYFIFFLLDCIISDFI